MDMSIQVARGKRAQIVETLTQRIHAGDYAPGDRLDGEQRLAREFSVSRGTVRQALSELQQRRLIATETGRGSFVIFDGHQLDQERGWAQALADTGQDVSVEILGIEPISPADVPLLPEDVHLEQGIAITRVRSLHRPGAAPQRISFECATVPGDGVLARLPATGLVEDSLSRTLRAAGYLPTHGTQSADVHRLDERQARLLGVESGAGYLRTSRTSFEDGGRFVEHVVSLLDPDHFTLSLSFGEER